MTSADVFRSLRASNVGSTAYTLITTVRIPRVLGGLFAGIGLACAGVILQSVMNNSLASPNTIGVNSGSGFAVMLAMMLFPSNTLLIPAFAFGGALLTSLAVFALAYLADSSRTTIILAGLPISRIVLMGIGEPLDNFDNVMRFLELVNSPDGLNISMRHISLSTCGLVPKIDELAKKKLQISLAISLHGPNDAIRDKIMPVNKAYASEELLAACRRYFDATGRRIHFEYAMIDGVNDGEVHAKELLRRLKGLPAHFNLIPLNHVEESPLKPSSKAAVAKFQKILEDGGITATVRRTLGGDIDASCGQLRRKYNKEKS